MMASNLCKVVRRRPRRPRVHAPIDAKQNPKHARWPCSDAKQNQPIGEARAPMQRKPAHIVLRRKAYYPGSKPKQMGPCFGAEVAEASRLVLSAPMQGTLSEHSVQNNRNTRDHCRIRQSYRAVVSVPYLILEPRFCLGDITVNNFTLLVNNFTIRIKVVASR